MTSQEVRTLFLQALMEETCCEQPAAPAQGVVTDGGGNGVLQSNGGTGEGVLQSNGGTGDTPTVTPTPETTTPAVNYWPLIALTAFTYLFLTDGRK